MSFGTDSGHVTVRMYNVGFGDAFLVAFPGRDRAARVLIDCGVHAASPRPRRPISEVVTHIIESVTDDDGVPHLDLVVGTHRHRDHVSAFDNPAWADVEVGEVWMPWTEDPVDPEARTIREAQSSVAKRLHFALSQLGADEGLVALAENALRNAPAMATLHRGFAGRPTRRFLSAEDAEPLEPSALGGVRVHVLGPPRDAETIGEMDPPKGESYFRMTSEQDADPAPPPFADEWELSAGDLADGARNHLVLAGGDLKRLDALERLTHFGLAVALENAVNGTSLVLAFEVGDALLLFPGDAQWGSWRRILEDERGRGLLARTTFYKVGHHGSHNATPKDFLEDVLSARRPAADEPLANLSAMVSTHSMRMWKFIPKAELMEALIGLSPRLARSDAPEPPAEGFTYEDDFFVETKVSI